MCDLAIFVSNLNCGGVGKNAIILANEYAKQGKKVDLVLLDDRGILRRHVSDKVNIVNLNTLRMRYSIYALIKYFKSSQPQSILVFPYTLLVPIISKIFSSSSNIVVTERTSINKNCFHGKGKGIKIYLSRLMMRCVYPLTSAVVLVSRHALLSLQNFLQSPSSKIRFSVIYNPCVFLSDNYLEKYPDNFPEWSTGSHKKILAVGRLDPCKDFVTLIQAFYQVSQDNHVKLMLVGEGKERKTLEALVEQLNLQEKVIFAGFQENVSDYYSLADLFVLSSISEGMPNVLLEALQFGVTIVSTDCESGPSEILDQGRFGILVPIQDPKALQEGILQGLNHPFDQDFLKSRVNDFSLEQTIQAYDQILF